MGKRAKDRMAKKLSDHHLTHAIKPGFARLYDNNVNDLRSLTLCIADSTTLRIVHHVDGDIDVRVSTDSHFHTYQYIDFNIAQDKELEIVQELCKGGQS